MILMKRKKALVEVVILKLAKNILKRLDDNKYPVEYYKDAIAGLTWGVWDIRESIEQSVEQSVEKEGIEK